MSMTRGEFKQVVEDAVALEFTNIPMQESKIDYIFSDNFIRKMDNLISMQEDGMSRLSGLARRYIVVIVIIILGISISSCGINQVITHFYGSEYEKIREKFYAGATATEITYGYGISKVPEGFEITDVTKSNGYKMIEYKNEKGNRICFLQDASEGVKIYIQDEKIEKTSTIIRDLEVIVFENKDLVGAMWVEDGCFMEIIYYGCKDVEEVIALVEAIQ